MISFIPIGMYMSNYYHVNSNNTNMLCYFPRLFYDIRVEALNKLD